MEPSTSQLLRPGVATQAKALLGAGVWWTASVIIGLFALVEGFSNRTFGGFLTAALAAALCAPPLQRKLRDHTGLAISPKIFKVLAAVALVASFAFMEQGKLAIQDAARQEARVAKDVLHRENQAKLKKQFVENKAQIISEIESQIAANKPLDALDEIGQYAAVVSDPALARLKETANIVLIKLELRNEHSLSLHRREEIYSRLLTAEPTNGEVYEPKLRGVRAELSAQQRVKAAARATAVKESAIAAQFSTWDGSHSKVEAALKARMHNPSSYKHVETRYSIGSDTLTVVTTYRGTNGFGGVVTNRAVAKTDLQGNVLSVESL